MQLNGGFTLRFGPTDQTKTSSATVWNGCITSPAVWGPSADSSWNWGPTEAKAICRRSLCASNWRETYTSFYESLPSEVLSGERRWRGSGRQPGSRKRLVRLWFILTCRHLRPAEQRRGWSAWWRRHLQQLEQEPFLFVCRFAVTEWDSLRPRGGPRNHRRRFVGECLGWLLQADMPLTTTDLL